MGTVTVIVLFIIAIALFFARQYNYISNEILQTILTITGIISGLAAVLVFVIAQPDPEPESTETPSVAISNTPTPTVSPTETPIPLTETPIPSTTTVIPPTRMPTVGIRSTISGKDGMTLLYVPEGEFLRGSKEDQPDADDHEKPQRSIYLDAFWIDETEVTNEMFARFVEEANHQTDAEKIGWAYIAAETTDEATDGAEWRHPQGPDSSIEGLEQHPVVQVSWNDAKAYCEWVGRRLPTEAEWEKAARGPHGRTYPWGNDEVAGNLVNLCDKNCPFSNKIETIDDGYELTAPVGSYPDGVSPYGALDMAGNVWEWTADSFEAEYYNDAPERNPQGPDTDGLKVSRGGSWRILARWVRAAYRNEISRANRYDDLGIRCALSD